MNKIKIHYEGFWSGRDERFESYVRNLSLTTFFNKGEALLDVGCGDGTVAEYLHKKLGLQVSGMDISEVAVEKARKRGVKAFVGSSEDRFPFNDNSFDAVFWGDNIEHLFDPMFAAKEIKRVLKPNGRLVLSCPNMAYWRYRIYYFLEGELSDTEWTGFNRWNWSHIRFFNINILKDFFKEAGYKRVSRIKGVSNRRIDKMFLPLSQTLFGMIILLEVKNE